MKKSISLLILCLILALSFSAAADEDRTISVTGTAVVVLEPDYAQLEMGVETESADVSEAQTENARIMDAVISALKQAGCADKDMKTSNFNVYSSYRYEQTSLGKQVSTLVYHVSNTLKVTVRDLEKVGAFIDAAAAAGANQMNSLTFLSHSTETAYTQALQDACADAREKAQIIADALGVKVAKVVHVSLPQYSSVPVFNNSPKTRAVGYAEEAAADTAIIAGGLSVSANVDVIFEIE